MTQVSQKDIRALALRGAAGLMTNSPLLFALLVAALLWRVWLSQRLGLDQATAYDQIQSPRAIGLIFIREACLAGAMVGAARAVTGATRAQLALSAWALLVFWEFVVAVALEGVLAAELKVYWTWVHASLPPMALRVAVGCTGASAIFLVSIYFLCRFLPMVGGLALGESSWTPWRALTQTRGSFMPIAKGLLVVTVPLALCRIAAGAAAEHVDGLVVGGILHAIEALFLLLGAAATGATGTRWATRPIVVAVAAA